MAWVKPVLAGAAISLSAILVGFARHSRDDSFCVLSRNCGFILLLAVGSVAGVAFGVQLLGVVPEAVLMPLLVAILLISSVKVWRQALD